MIISIKLESGFIANNDQHMIPTEDYQHQTHTHVGEIVDQHRLQIGIADNVPVKLE